MNSQLFYQARLIDPATGRDEKGGLLVQSGKIVDLGSHINVDHAPEGAEIFDCKGLILMPGLIDMRVQLGEPGEEHREDFTSGSKAALAGGITSMVILPNTKPVIDDVATVEFVTRRASETNLAKIYCFGAATKGLLGRDMAEFGLLAEAGARGFTDGHLPIADAALMRRILAYAKTFDLLLLQHPEEPSLAKGGVMNGGELATRLGLPSIPACAEAMMIERDLHLVRLTGGRYHASRVSTADAITALRRAKKEGLNVTSDTSPAYFALNENEIGDYRTFARLSPPLRGEEDRMAIVEGLADGTIDVIVSDHTPLDQESKRLPFAQAEPGIVGLETLLPLTLELFHRGKIPLLPLLKTLTAHPSRLLKLSQGTLEKGKPADLLILDIEQPWVIDTSQFFSKSKNSPYDQRPVQGRVIQTFVEGRRLYG